MKTLSTTLKKVIAYLRKERAISGMQGENYSTQELIVLAFEHGMFDGNCPHCGGFDEVLIEGVNVSNYLGNWK
jgi:hypothetical protein